MDRRWKLFVPVLVSSLAADQITKKIAEKALMGKGPISVIENHWDWVLAYNTGSAFSMFTDQRLFLTIIGVAAVAGLIWWMIKRGAEQTSMTLLALGLMAGGAIGNLIDRILYGKVTDFILWRYYDRHWPVFNIADVCLTVAVAMFLILGFVEKRQQKTAATA